MKDRRPRTVRLQDYRPPDHLVERVDLRFDIRADHTRVRARLTLRRNPRGRRGAPLVLHGEALDLRGLWLDGRPLAASRYRQDEGGLTLHRFPGRAVLEVETWLRPQDNTALEGLYVSGPILCTQCEAEGFRRITFYPDRPDVLAPFTTQIIADRDRHPVLLSNGNRIGAGELPGGRHWVQWADPFPKPSYLFALVAGDLACLEDRYTTASGRRVRLRLYSEPRDIEQCRFAMAALKRAMRWDEERFGLEYDLDVYMIVAVSSFNMGAMENKGLNIFNTACILAGPETATDADHERVESVIGHEYFHNWTGNRVTCRDWFQLSLKEGLTVFRDQEFTADLHSRAVKRIDDVRNLRAVQFPEDAGPMAHPVRPRSYMEINNFYTATVYEKGAELVRMLQTLAGREGFRAGLRRYLARHDGRAATVEDFLAAMAQANHLDLRQFKRWYDYAGTPVVRARGRYQASTRRYWLTLEQSCPPTPGQRRKPPLHIPVAVGLLDPDGRELPLRLAGEPRPRGTTRVLELRRRRQRFCFEDVPAPPVPSLLRGFSAPVRLETDAGPEQLAFLLARDPDPFNRWEAGQRLALGLILDAVAGRADPARETAFLEALETFLETAAEDPAYAAEVLTLPGETYIGEQMEIIDVEGVHAAREALRRRLAGRLAAALNGLYRRLGENRPGFDHQAAARRRLKNLCLDYLVTGDPPRPALAWRQFRTATNMTDAYAALACLARLDCEEREAALAAFHRRWRDHPLVVDKWFAVQAASPLPDTLDRVRALLGHPDFRLTEPNRVRALLGSFAHRNPVRFHAADGAGYRLVADQVIALDRVNPQVAARLAGALTRWRRYDPGRARRMRAELERLRAQPRLSRDLQEIVAKSL